MAHLESRLCLIALSYLVSFLRFVGLMLFGMVPLGLHVIAGNFPTRHCILTILFAILIGVPMVLYGIVQNVSHNWELSFHIGPGAQFDYWGSLIIVPAMQV